MSYIKKSQELKSDTMDGLHIKEDHKRIKCYIQNLY